MHNSNHSRDPFSAESLQLFAATLSGMAPQEVRKAKLLYLRNAISEYHASKATVAQFKTAQGCFRLNPFFWPILKLQSTLLDSGQNLARERIHNAIDVWKEDLQGESFTIDGQTRNL